MSIDEIELIKLKHETSLSIKSDLFYVYIRVVLPSLAFGVAIGALLIKF